MSSRTGAQSDAELVDRVRGGDPDAFDRLMDRHIDAAYAVALALTGDATDAEDISQDSFLVALQRLEQCREPARFRGWVLQIVRNRAHNFRRSLGIRAEVDLDRVVPLRSASNPVGDAERSELHDTVLQALLKLSELQRQVVMLFDMEGWNHAEIAESLGITVGASRAALFKARSALRRLLEDYSDKRQDNDR